MIPSHQIHKPARFKYGTPDGWDFNNGIVAFGETPRQERLRIARSIERENNVDFEKERKKRRL